MAFELYTPETLPLRLIAAFEESSPECIASLTTRGFDPTRFEFVRL